MLFSFPLQPLPLGAWMTLALYLLVFTAVFPLFKSGRSDVAFTFLLGMYFPRNYMINRIRPRHATSQ